MKESISTFSTQVAEILKTERKARNLSHEKLAVLSGLSRRAIGKIESGERVPTIVTVHRLLLAMELSWSDFANKLDKR